MRTLGLLLLTTVVAQAGCGAAAYDEDDPRSVGLPAAKDEQPLRPLVESEYRLPWSCGERYFITQGNAGDMCDRHDGDHVKTQAYAWDFALPRHTPVVASRGGVVTVAKNVVGPGQKCYDGCDSAFGTAEFAACCSECLLVSNRVNVRHDDGTVATYWHLDVATVQLGQVVRAGELLGYSGTSGCSTGPHLHFQVMDSCPAGYCQSQPILFVEGGAPGCGERVESRNCG